MIWTGADPKLWGPTVAGFKPAGSHLSLQEYSHNSQNLPHPCQWPVLKGFTSSEQSTHCLISLPEILRNPPGWILVWFLPLFAGNADLLMCMMKGTSMKSLWSGTSVHLQRLADELHSPYTSLVNWCCAGVSWNGTNLGYCKREHLPIAFSLCSQSGFFKQTKHSFVHDLKAGLKALINK